MQNVTPVAFAVGGVTLYMPSMRNVTAIVRPFRAATFCGRAGDVCASNERVGA
jgi:hypothetical protein